MIFRLEFLILRTNNPHKTKEKRGNDGQLRRIYSTQTAHLELLERIHAIADFLANLIQHPFTSCSTNSLEPFSDHHHRSPSSAALGSGLAILSRFPIISSHFHPYLLNGHPLHFIQGDFFVGKSVGSCLLDVPMIGEVEVFTTHLYAPHDVPAPEWKRAHRTAQAWELGKLVNASAERGRTVFVCGDLNSVPTSLPITLLQSHGQLRDSWTTSHVDGQTTHTTNESSFRTAIEEEGMTCDSMINTFTASKNAANRGAKGYGKRLDYILYRPAAKRVSGRDPLQSNHSHTHFIDDQIIRCDFSKVILTEPIPVFGFSYSDHFAVEASFTVYPSQSSRGVDSDEPIDQRATQESNQTDIRPPSLTSEQINNCISALMIKYRSSERSSQIQLSLFIICIILCGVGGLGMTMLYSGFLAGNWEHHFAVEAFFTVYPSQSSRGVDSDEPIDQRATQESNQTDIRPPSLTSEQINNCISALMIKYRSSERSSQIQLSLFIICIILVPGISIAASFQPLKYLNWIFTLLSVGVGGLGMTMLYSGFLAGNWERSAIQEICDQLEFQLNLTLQNQNQNHHLSL
ncbi:hypothetical protein PSTT_03788 [Puccinia striiformis]|uniref:Endonuclease/exonuclease/phosphatase domain-containing protein n=2 Tax=Puccinia striiformis TaxID=27350 RepID=A0A2S4VV28_9BASI|nr:hypothetical protein PSTT_03788 [Puccinia striiformis]